VTSLSSQDLRLTSTHHLVLMTPKNGFSTVSPSDVKITWDGHIDQEVKAGYIY